ncbi:MAG: short-chain dehydrogenase/reductase [Chloroflexi bacterium]|nr:short-chain dehydrogenase/reductase [Chloroflexota bacterium]
MTDVALVTGASTGIGNSTALHLARNGYHVFATMRNPSAGQELDQIAKDEKLSLDVLALDVNDEESAQACIDEAVSRSGQIDVLVNNAGVGGGGSIEETPLGVTRDVFETNVFGALRMTQLVLPGMREREHGSIVNVTSVAGRVASPSMGAYVGSKFALDAMTEVLAAEVFRFGIRVALIEPGVVLTPIFTKRDDRQAPPEDSPYKEFADRIGHHFATKLQNPAMPEDVAEVILSALTTTEPKLRYLVGTDAISLMDARDNVSDEEWIAMGRRMSLEEFAAAQEALGVDLS